MPKLPTRTPQFDPLYKLILVSLIVFMFGLFVTNEQARLVFLHPFS
ncbi:MAG: hypothetical protein ACKOQ3_04245 [Novosphingobium sp.]